MKNFKIDDIFKPIPINNNNEILKGYNIFVNGKPSCLLHEKMKAAYKISNNGIFITEVQQQFKKSLREDMEKNHGYIFEIIKRNVEDTPVEFINKVAVNIGNVNWQRKWCISIKKGTTDEIIKNTRKVLEFLSKNNVEIADNGICPQYCGLPVDTDNIEVAKKYKRK